MTRPLFRRIERMERDAAGRAVHDGEDARLLRRIGALLPLVPTDSLRQLLRAGSDGEPPSAAQREAEERSAMLLETGAWPA